MAGLIGRDRLLAKEKLEIEKLDLGNGDFVYVTEMTAAEQGKLQETFLSMKIDSKDLTQEKLKENIQESIQTTNLELYKAALVVLTICDEKGEKLLKWEDRKELNENMGAKTMDKIVKVAQKLNKISEEDKEELIKN